MIRTPLHTQNKLVVNYIYKSLRTINIWQEMDENINWMTLTHLLPFLFLNLRVPFVNDYFLEIHYII